MDVDTSRKHLPPIILNYNKMGKMTTGSCLPYTTQSPCTTHQVDQWFTTGAPPPGTGLHSGPYRCLPSDVPSVGRMLTTPPVVLGRREGKAGSAMETESVKSGHSQHSSRSRRSRGHVAHLSHDSGSVVSNHVTSPHRTHNGHRPRHSHRSTHSARSERLLGGSIFGPPTSMKGDLEGSLRGVSGVGGMVNGGNGEEVIEVQILPQDDNWGDNTTAITGNTSDRSASVDDFSRMGDGGGRGGEFGHHQRMGLLFRCHRYAGSFLAAVLSAAAFASPVAMVVLPRLPLLEWKEENLVCGPECDSALISFSFKLLILIAGTWAVFFRQPKATMPRIFIFRACILALVFVFTFSYWLFYGVRVLERRDEVTYYAVVQFALSLVDALLFIHYLAVILIEIRQLQPQYSVKVVRSPDGESRHYNMGQLSIQRSAVWVLERYYRDFSIFNPYLERLPSRGGGGTSSSGHHKSVSGFKFYDMDGGGGSSHHHHATLQGQSRAVMAANARRRDSSHNERFYEEHEYERRVKKRRARLVTTTEEAFTHIKRLHDEQGPAIPMDPMEAAQSIFPSMSRALQKYLRITRQQPRHSMESILRHLALCLSYDLTPKAFLEKYIVSAPVLQSDREHRPVQTWGLVCDTLLSRAVESGTVFQLRQSDVSLLCIVQRIPHFNVTEEILDPKSNKFVLRLNSETSV